MRVEERQPYGTALTRAKAESAYAEWQKRKFRPAIRSRRKFGPESADAVKLLANPNFRFFVLYKDGWTIREIATFKRVHRSSVREYICRMTDYLNFDGPSRERESSITLSELRESYQ